MSWHIQVHTLISTSCHPLSDTGGSNAYTLKHVSNTIQLTLSEPPLTSHSPNSHSSTNSLHQLLSWICKRLYCTAVLLESCVDIKWWWHFRYQTFFAYVTIAIIKQALGNETTDVCHSVAYPGILLGGSTNSVEDRENGDLGAVGP